MADQESRDDRNNRESRPRSDQRPPQSSGAGKRPPAKHGGDRKPYEKRDGAKSNPPRDGERKPYQGSKPYAPRDGERKSYPPRDGERKPYQGSKPYAPRDGERKSYPPRDGERKSNPPRDGERKPYQGSKPYAPRDGERKSYPPRDGERRSYPPRDGERKPYGSQDQHRGGRPTRGGADRPVQANRPEENRPVRVHHDDPFLPDEITPADLPAGARNELKTLSKENAEWVARHLAMAAKLIDIDPELAHEHAISASRRAGRIAIVRETLAITAYATGDFALALRELRTYRRISGRDDQIALMVDSERGVGRPDRALEVGRAVDRATLPTGARVELAIAMSGARLDLGEPDRALLELEIPELDPDRAFEWSPALFAARATVLEELGRDAEAEEWHRRAEVAADALDAASGVGDLETIIVDEVEELHLDEDEPDAAEPDAKVEVVGDDVGDSTAASEATPHAEPASAEAADQDA